MSLTTPAEHHIAIQAARVIGLGVDFFLFIAGVGADNFIGGFAAGLAVVSAVILSVLIVRQGRP